MFGIAGIDGIAGALLRSPVIFDERPENTPAFALKINKKSWKVVVFLNKNTKI